MIIQQLNVIRMSIIESYNSMINTYSYESDRDFKLENVRNEYKAQRAIEYTLKLDDEPPFLVVYSRLSKPINGLYRQIENISEKFVYSPGTCVVFKNTNKTLYACKSDGKVRIDVDDVIEDSYAYLSDNKGMEKLLKMLDKAYKICFPDEIEYSKLPMIHLQQCENIQSQICEYNKNLWGIFKKNQNKFLEYTEMKGTVKLKTPDKNYIELRVKSSSTEDPFKSNEKMKYMVLNTEAINILDSGDFGVAYQYKTTRNQLRTIYVIHNYDSKFRVIVADDLVSKSIIDLRYENLPYMFTIIICKLLRIMKVYVSDNLFGLYNYNKLRVYDFTNFDIEYDLCALECDDKFE